MSAAVWDAASQSWSPTLFAVALQAVLKEMNRLGKCADPDQLQVSEGWVSSQLSTSAAFSSGGKTG